MTHHVEPVPEFGVGIDLVPVFLSKGSDVVLELTEYVLKSLCFLDHDLFTVFGLTLVLLLLFQQACLSLIHIFYNMVRQ